MELLASEAFEAREAAEACEAFCFCPIQYRAFFFLNSALKAKTEKEIGGLDGIRIKTTLDERVAILTDEPILSIKRKGSSGLAPRNFFGTRSASLRQAGRLDEIKNARSYPSVAIVIVSLKIKGLIWVFFCGESVGV